MQISLTEVQKYFAITSISAPTSGIIFSVIVFSCIGGYNKSRAHDAVCIFGLLACFAACPTPFLNDRNALYVLLWLVFFFGSIMLAPLVGIMLNQVKATRRTTANSLATMCYNLLGFLPAPFIFGLVADMNKDNPEMSMRYALGVVTYWSCVSLIFLMIAYILILKRKAYLKE